MGVNLHYKFMSAWILAMFRSFNLEKALYLSLNRDNFEFESDRAGLQNALKIACKALG